MILSSRENPAIQQYQKCRLHKKFRDRFGLFCLEGVRLVCDAIKSNASLEKIFVTESCFERHAELFADVGLKASDVLFVTEELALWLSDISAPQGLFALAKKLDKPQYAVTIKENGCYLALCFIQDPGNLGTMLRTADALAMDHVFLCGGCDIYHPKVVRSTMGALFHLPFSVCMQFKPLLKQFADANLPTIATVVSKPAEDVFSLSDHGRGGVLLIGNEGNGLPPELVAACDRRVTIPMPGGAESLNAAVAASVCMWELVRERIQKGMIP